MDLLSDIFNFIFFKNWNFSFSFSNNFFLREIINWKQIFLIPTINQIHSYLYNRFNNKYYLIYLLLLIDYIYFILCQQILFSKKNYAQQFLILFISYSTRQRQRERELLAQTRTGLTIHHSLIFSSSSVNRAIRRGREREREREDRQGKIPRILVGETFLTCRAILYSADSQCSMTTVRK